MKKHAKTTVICMSLLTMLLSGCNSIYGLGKTISLVEDATASKKAIDAAVAAKEGDSELGEMPVNVDLGMSSVGTVSVEDNQRVSMDNAIKNVLKVTADGTSFKAEWEFGKNLTNLEVQIFADTDNKGNDGIKIASTDGCKSKDSYEFEFKGLETGDYYFYAKVTPANKDDANYVYTEETSYVTSSLLKTLKNVNIQVIDGMVHFKWDSADGATQYRTMIMDEETEAIIMDTVTTNCEATMNVPVTKKTFKAAVATFDRSVLGEYVAVTINADESAEFDVSCDKGSSTPDRTANITIDWDDTSATNSVDIYLNGNKVNNKSISEPATISLNLAVGANVIKVQGRTAAGNVTTKEITIECTAYNTPTPTSSPEGTANTDASTPSTTPYVDDAFD